MFDWFWEFLYKLVRTIFNCVDFILDFAKMLAGITPIQVENEGTVENTELTLYFLRDETVLDAFKLVALIGVVLMFVFTIFAIVRSIGQYTGEGKSVGRVCFDGAKAMLYLLLVPAIMIIGAVVVSTVMTSIYNALNISGSTLGGRLFTLISREAQLAGGFNEDVANNFATGVSGYDYTKLSDVKTYYSLKEMDYFLAFVGGIAVLILLVKPLISFVERIVSLVMLFLVAPISVSTVPLDEGARFKLWREQVINKFLIAYGSLISLNVFMLLMSIVLNVRFFESNGWNDLAQLVFIIGGAAACQHGPVLIGNLINQGAGSQYAQDAAHVSSPFGRIGSFAAGKAIGFAKGAGRNTVGKGVDAVKSKATEPLRRKLDARRAIRSEAARNKEFSRQSAKFEKSSSRVPKTKLGEAGRKNDWRNYLSNFGGEGAGRSLEQVLRGRGFTAGGKSNNNNDSTANQRGQSTLVDAMSKSRTNTGGGDKK